MQNRRIIPILDIGLTGVAVFFKQVLQRAIREAGYINATFVSMAGAYLPGLKGVYDITYNGHEFLNAIREPTRWEQVKTSAAKIGSFSLETAAEIARNLITAAIPSVLQSVLK